MLLRGDGSVVLVLTATAVDLVVVVVARVLWSLFHILHVVLLLHVDLNLGLGGRGGQVPNGGGAGGMSTRQAQQGHSRQEHQESWKTAATEISGFLDNNNRTIWRIPPAI